MTKPIPDCHFEDEEHGPMCAYSRGAAESYATAKAAEAVQRALEEAAMLFNQPHQEYFGRDIQDAIRSMTKYAPKKEQGNG